MLISRVKLPVCLEVVVARVVAGQLERARAVDGLVEAHVLLIAVMVGVLDRGHVLNLTGGLGGDLAKAGD